MDTNKYLIITHSEDGYDTEIVTKEEFIKRITPSPPHRDTYYSGDYPMKFVDDPKLLPQEPDKERWIFVCKLDVVIPKAVETVTRYEVP